MSVALVIQHAARMRRFILSSVTSLALPYFSINGTIFRKKFIELKVCFSSLQLLSEAFLILRRISNILSQMYVRLHVKYPLFLSDFNET